MIPQVGRVDNMETYAGELHRLITNYASFELGT